MYFGGRQLGQDGNVWRMGLKNTASQKKRRGRRERIGARRERTGHWARCPATGKISIGNRQEGQLLVGSVMGVVRCSGGWRDEGWQGKGEKGGGAVNRK